MKPLTVNAQWVYYAHNPGAEDEQPLAVRLCELITDNDAPIKLTDVDLVREVLSVAELYDGASSVQDDDRLWFRVYPGKLIKRCKAWLTEAQAQ